MTVKDSGSIGKKWCIGKQNIKKGLLKKDFKELCKEIDCSATRAKGIYYDEFIWSKASYAMNLNIKKTVKKDSNCNHEGRVEIVITDPNTSSTLFLRFLYLFF